ncbi:hypothetical protein IAQ61_009698 [Plenodomus lingam]|uniref:Predicted protein n=1 Tax=Leptosphaeria maculans (strain JN3 / isolate v23.1.3 / race Av1-4-5-6-7-8) TaxID=985895 RepID=E4ZT24_LEPMJ|nr:predicted protein [Plenodomus lingam JN3]KAH9863420.1 hypothetical protein IAQ61_009698 [Plenodomus lingam]CBX94455.1 predicted protein [Plenodomus lingam JN3]
MSDSPGINNNRHGSVAVVGLGSDIAKSGRHDDASENSNEAQECSVQAENRRKYRNDGPPRTTSSAALDSEPNLSQARLSGNRKGLRIRVKPESTSAKSGKQWGNLVPPASFSGEQDENAGHDDEDAVRRAIQLSLADQFAPTSPGRPNSPVDESDFQNNVTIIKPLPLFGSEKALASNSMAPQAFLDNLIPSMNDIVERLEKCAEKNRAVNLWELASHVKKWEQTLTAVGYSIEAAERRRWEDLQMHVQLDSEIQEKHDMEMARVTQGWQEKLNDRASMWMRTMEELDEHHRIQFEQQHELCRKKLEEQKQMYEREIALQTVETASHDAKSGLGGRPRSARALSPSPTVIMRRQTDITGPYIELTDSECENDTSQVAPNTPHQLGHDLDTLQPIARGQTSGDGANSQTSPEGVSDIKHTCNAHSHRHRKRSARVPASGIQGETRKNRHNRSTGSEDSGGVDLRTSRSPEKRKRDMEHTEVAVERSWSPKKTKSK